MKRKASALMAIPLALAQSLGTYGGFFDIPGLVL